MKPLALTDTTAERAVLGCCLLEGRIPDAAQGLKPEDFGHAEHSHVFAAMLALHAGGVHVDGLTLSERLKSSGRLADVGGPAALMQLDELVPSTASLPAFVATVRDMALRRGIVAQARSMAESARDTRKPAVRIADEAKTACANLAAIGSADDDEMGGVDVIELADRWDAYYRGEHQPYLACGMETLDEVFRGFHNNLNLVGGKASMGKTAFVASCIGGWLRKGLMGGIFGLEDGTAWLTERHAAKAVGIPYEQVAATRLHDYQQEILAKWMGEWHALLNEKLLVHRHSGLHAPDLIRKAERWIRKGARWLVVDHGGRITHETGDSRERYDLAIRRTCEALDNLAHNARVPIIVNWHFNRTGATQGKPSMEAFKESGYLEAFSGSMLGLWERAENPGALLVTVVKNRKGRRDVTVALRRAAEYGLVRSDGGEVLDLDAEARARAEERSVSRPSRRNVFDPERGAA